MRWERPAAVFSAVLGLILLGVGGAILSIQGRLTTTSGYPLIAGVALLIAYALLDRFASVNPKIRVSVQDPFVDPVQARQFGVITSGTVVIRYGSKTQLLNSGSQGEQDVASAVLKLESSRSPSVCWTVGEGERDLKDAAQITGYSDAAAQLAAENFTQRDLLLSQTGEIGSSCDIVVIMGPSKPLTDTGAKALAAYLDAGGSLLLALDPWTDP